jgi:membrane protein
MNKKFTKTEIDSTRTIILFLASVAYSLAFYFLNKYYYLRTLVISDYIIYFYIALTVVSALILAFGIILWYRRYRKSINESEFIFSGGFFIFFGSYAFLTSLAITLIPYKNLFTVYTYIIIAIAFVTYLFYKLISLNFAVYTLICGYTVISLISMMDFYSDSLTIQVINLIPRYGYYLMSIAIALVLIGVVIFCSIRQNRINRKYNSKKKALSIWPAAIFIGIYIISIIVTLFYYNYVFMSALIINIVVLLILAILKKARVIKI